MKYEINKQFKDWTLDELQVAITTMEHDLRGSWNSGYGSRMSTLCELCEEVMAYFENTNKKVAFKEVLKGKKEFAEMAMHDFQVTKDEMVDQYDGRVFRDSARFYDLPLSKAGKTEQVIDWLSWNVECDDYHWFQRNDV